MPREWNTPAREAWNTPIHQILKAIDNHTAQYLLTGDEWHTSQAEVLRKYVADLKHWIHDEERKNITDPGG
jgi:predicted NAD/FAD-binding protein